MNKVGDWTGARVTYSLMLQAAGDGAGGDVEEPARHRGALPEPRLLRHRARHPPADVAGAVDLGEAVAEPRDPEGRQQLGVVNKGVDVDQAGPGAVGDLAERLAGEPETDVI